MATEYTHALAGLALARLCATKPMPWAYWAMAAVLPVLPDVDVFFTGPYGSPLGHRGITHSLAFALVVGGAAAGATCRYFRTSWWRLAVVLFVIVASHGLLDAMTVGGGRIPFFWPLDGWYGNWGPLRVSDIAMDDLPDPRHSRALRAELLWIWLPAAVLVAVVTGCRRCHSFRSARGQ